MATGQEDKWKRGREDKGTGRNKDTGNIGTKQKRGNKGATEQETTEPGDKETKGKGTRGQGDIGTVGQGQGDKGTS